MRTYLSIFGTLGVIGWTLSAWLSSLNGYGLDVTMLFLSLAMIHAVVACVSWRESDEG